MAKEMEIELALANLEAGKFSIRMVEAIKEHIETLENEVTDLQSLHASALSDLKIQQIANWRLEGEVRKLNGTIYALLKANVATEKTYQAAAFAGEKAVEYFRLARDRGTPEAIRLTNAAVHEMTPVVIKLGELLQDAVQRARPKAALLLERTIQEAAPVAIKLGEQLKGAARQISHSRENTLAQISDKRDTAA